MAVKVPSLAGCLNRPPVETQDRKFIGALVEILPLFVVVSGDKNKKKKKKKEKNLRRLVCKSKFAVKCKRQVQVRVNIVYTRDHQTRTVAKKRKGSFVSQITVPLNDLIRKRLDAVASGDILVACPRGESGLERPMVPWYVPVAVLVSGIGFWSAAVGRGPRLKWKQMKLDVMRSCGEGEPVL